MQSTEVRLDRLSKHYHQHAAVDRVSLTIAPGHMLALLGPSGCGKTTCLRMIAGLVAPSAGDIFVNGRPVTRVPVHKRNVGMLFQNYALFPHMSVAENVAFGLQMRRMGRAEVERRVREALDLVQLAHLADRLPSQLSGGQQQRIGLARALVIEPSMLLLDEPLGALDKSLRESMQVELRALQQRLGITTIMVTHDQDEALTMADQVVVMRAGRLEQVGSASEVYQRPATRFVAGFIGVSNFLEGVVERRDGGSALVATPSGVRLALDAAPEGTGPVTVSLRPESVSVEPVPPGAEHGTDPNTALAEVEQVIYRGFISQYYLRLRGGEQIIAFGQNQDGGAPPRLVPGDAVMARWSNASNHVIPAEPALATQH